MQIPRPGIYTAVVSGGLHAGQLFHNSSGGCGEVVGDVIVVAALGGDRGCDAVPAGATGLRFSGFPVREWTGWSGWLWDGGDVREHRDVAAAHGQDSGRRIRRVERCE